MEGGNYATLTNAKCTSEQEVTLDVLYPNEVSVESEIEGIWIVDEEGNEIQEEEISYIDKDGVSKTMKTIVQYVNIQDDEKTSFLKLIREQTPKTSKAQLGKELNFKVKFHKGKNAAKSKFTYQLISYDGEYRIKHNAQNVQNPSSDKESGETNNNGEQLVKGKINVGHAGNDQFIIIARDNNNNEVQSKIITTKRIKFIQIFFEGGKVLDHIPNFDSIIKQYDQCGITLRTLKIQPIDKVDYDYNVLNVYLDMVKSNATSKVRSMGYSDIEKKLIIIVFVHNLTDFYNPTYEINTDLIRVNDEVEINFIEGHEVFNDEKKWYKGCYVTPESKANFSDDAFRNAVYSSFFDNKNCSMIKKIDAAYCSLEKKQNKVVGCCDRVKIKFTPEIRNFLTQNTCRIMFRYNKRINNIAGGQFFQGIIVMPICTLNEKIDNKEIVNSTIHEIGHRFNLVSMSNQNIYEGRGHSGPHCNSGLEEKKKNIYGEKENSEANCVMYGYCTTEAKTFCEYCKKDLIQMDLSKN